MGNLSHWYQGTSTRGSRNLPQHQPVALCIVFSYRPPARAVGRTGLLAMRAADRQLSANRLSETARYDVC